MREVFHGVYHLEDRMGVHMTLLVGDEQALLFDTGYGLDDVSAMVREITDLPLTVVLSHGHHDHALGCQWFDRVYLHPDDLPVYGTYTGEFWRKSVLFGARARSLSVDEDLFLSRPVAKACPLCEESIDLGGITARFLHAPGHTPGSLIVHVPERNLLLTADDWNPVTWCFFPEAMPVQTLLGSLRSALALPFDSVLCSHSGDVHSRQELLSFADFCTPDRIRDAEKTELGKRFGNDVRRISMPDGKQLCFDYQKALHEKQ